MDKFAWRKQAVCGFIRLVPETDEMTAPKHFDAATIRRAFTYDVAIGVVREAMIALSNGRAKQLLRSFIARDAGTFALMPAALSGKGYFGAKLVSVFFQDDGRRAHEGLVVLFDGESGKTACTADAGEITHVRTAAASAAATDTLARKDAKTLAVLGIGKQAVTHIEAIARVRDLSEVRVWGRSLLRAEAFAAEMAKKTGLVVLAVETAEAAAKNADIICTVTSASEPVLEARWVAPGTHINVVGSSGPGPVEIDEALVVGSRFIADHREHVLVHGAEFLRAKASGAVSDAHVVAEIGEVFAGLKPGRTSETEITVYKSLGHAVQDLTATAWLYENVR
jgi:ornithine cyclodeaminase/alanine dehydrogenase-like protein (mu-crystallin family)